MPRLKTIAVREATPTSDYLEQSEALFLTSSFRARNAEEARAKFANELDGYIYSRFSNPTVRSFELRLAQLEGGEDCIATASGMSAILLIALALLRAGDEVVCAHEVFGATIRLFGEVMARFGVSTRFVTLDNMAQWQAAMNPKVKLLFLESPSNPLTRVADIQALAQLAHANSALLVVDNCLCTPALQRPLALGADLVMHSATKFLDGQGRVLGGALVGSHTLIHDQLYPVLRTCGMSMSPFNAWVCLKGCETLDLRVRAQSANALELARWLASHPGVQTVHHPGLPSHPQHALALRQQDGVGGALLSFEVRPRTGESARAAAWRVIDATKICSITANLGDTKTTITHPATTSHGRLSEAEREAAGISQALVRVAVGLEDVEDLREDLQRGLQA